MGNIGDVNVGRVRVYVFGECGGLWICLSSLDLHAGIRCVWVVLIYVYGGVDMYG